MHSCCLLATEDERETEAEAFDCETCPVRQWQAQFDDLDRMAMDLFRVVSRPSVQQMGLTDLVLSAWPAELTPEDTLGLVERVADLHEHALRRARDVKGADDGS